MWQKQLKQWKVLAEVSALTCALLHSVCNLEVAQMKVQHNLIPEHMLYEFELGHNTAMEATKKICCVKEKGVKYSNQRVQEILPLRLQVPWQRGKFN